jgi:hypothetical protein
VAIRALRALARLAGEDDLPFIADATLSSAKPVSVAAEGALAKLGARFPSAARELARSISADATRELPAAILLGAGASSGVLAERDASFLAHAATAGDPRARRAAVDAVSALRAASGAAYPAALEVLSFALTDEVHEVQVAAARALGRLCSAPEAPRASDVLDLVDRSGAADLVAATVRAIGEGMSATESPSTELVSALALFARGAPSQVALAAVDSLGHAHRAGAASAIGALASAIDHPDEDVVKAAILKISSLRSDESTDLVCAALAKGLAHASPAVRLVAVESLGEEDTAAARAELLRHLAVETDRRVEDAIRLLLPSGIEGGER